VQSRLLAVVTIVSLPLACASAPLPSPASPPPAVAPAPTPAPAPPPAPTENQAAAPPAARPAAPPRALQQALDAARKAIAAGDMTAADKQIAAATSAAGDDAHFAFLVASMRATRFAYAADFEQAAAAYLAVIPTLAKHSELPDELWSHNAMMMIREAQGDPAAALAENDQATLCAARGTWDPQGREPLALQKDRWHRAYLTRMLAESRTGSVKQALLLYARAALDDYRPIGFPESVAVLEAYFAALDGDSAAALAAAKRVDPAKDDDVEDLYLVVVGLEAGGDHAAAEEVRRIMRSSQGVYLARPIMLHWLDVDANPRTRESSPWHARSR
jgi:hypothetical protein